MNRITDIAYIHPSLVEKGVAWLVKGKHNKYAFAVRFYAFLYYLTRLAAGLSAGALPFTISQNPTAATVLSAVIVTTTVIDLVFNPRERWALYSKATDLLAIAQLKASGEYDTYKEFIDIIAATEREKLERLVNLNELVASAGHSRVTITEVSEKPTPPDGAPKADPS
jgi:hypothetical protein